MRVSALVCWCHAVILTFCLLPRDSRAACLASDDDDNDGWVTALLTPLFSSKIFLILGRINFPTFMIHMLLIWYNNFNLHHPLEYRAFPLVSESEPALLAIYLPHRTLASG